MRTLAALHPPSALQDSDRAAAILADCIEQGKKILIVGDYDADGATGSAVACLGLRALGASAVDHLIPSRFAYGYDFSPAVAEAAAQRAPDLIITVDNGIASIAGVARANELGIPVLITDHHLPAAQLPAALAIVNPNRPDCAFPSKHLTGVGVMFYLLAATRARLRARGWFAGARAEPQLAELLDLVALGTIADVATLDHNNRILVEQGLLRIRAGRCRPGLRALLDLAGMRIDRVSARDLAFGVAPRLNAAGRIENMALGVACLLADDPRDAMRLAQQLEALNRRRRSIESAIRAAAEEQIAQLGTELNALPEALCLYRPDWHQGIVGIVAARLRDRYARPAIVFARAADGTLRGSVRSCDGLHARDLIAGIDSAQPGLIVRFGGHATAAGLTLPSDAFEPFRAAFTAAVRGQLGPMPAVREVCSDGELAPQLLTLDTAEALRLAAPWGKGFAEPLFDGEFEVIEVQPLRGGHLRLRVRTGQAPPVGAIGFGQGEQSARVGTRVRLVYRLEVNEYRGLRQPQLIIEHLHAL